MDELGGGGAGASGEVPTFDQGNGEPATGGISGNTAAGDPPTDHEEVDGSVGERGKVSVHKLKEGPSGMYHG
jgi:hypothetical protein